MSEPAPEMVPVLIWVIWRDPSGRCREDGPFPSFETAAAHATARVASTPGLGEVTIETSSNRKDGGSTLSQIYTDARPLQVRGSRLGDLRKLGVCGVSAHDKTYRCREPIGHDGPHHDGNGVKWPSGVSLGLPD